MRTGTLASLYRATNAIILGSRLADKLGAKVNATLTVLTTEGVRVNATVVGIFHTGVRSQDETIGYVLLKTGQILAAQTGLVNEIRVRLRDPLGAVAIAGRIERQTGYQATAWQTSNEDLLNAFVLRNTIMYTVVGAILLVASFGTYNIISTITHEKARDIAIMKSLGLSEGTVRTIFVIEGMVIGVIGAVLGWVFGYALCLGLGSIEFKGPFTDATRLPVLYSATHYAIATAVAVGSSVVASYFPASKAAAGHPVEIIRGAT
jgi:lipoprotein-releasing system permease protein